MGCSSSPVTPECELCRSSFYYETSLHQRGTCSYSSEYPVSWIKPSELKLKYRIGRGQFGDVWLSSLQYTLGSGKSQSEQQVAVKMLPLVAKEMTDTVLRRFDSVLFACQGLKGVSVPLGVSMKNDKVCILSSLYEGSVGGRMAHLPGNKLPISDVLRFGRDIAKAVIGLHSQGIISLSLKPCNFLLNSEDEAVVGDYGVPLLFSGCTYFGLKFWLGTPNYMAPEQWNVATRGPITYETDSWGFGCSIVEMLTGRKPWDGRSPQEIYNSVVLKGEKPCIPSGLPLALQRVLEACFEYDYRNRPDFYDILTSLTSPNIVMKQGDWVHLSEEAGQRIGVVKSTGQTDVLVQFSKKESQLHSQEWRGLNSWKDPLQPGDHVRLKKLRRSTPHETEGVVVVVDKDDILVGVKFCGSQEMWEGKPDELELVSLGLSAGDWVHRSTADEDQLHDHVQASCVGIVHNVQHDGDVQVAFIGFETLWTGPPSKLSKISPFRVGQTVKLCLPPGRSPRFEWPSKKTVGRIFKIMPNGCFVLGHPGRPWRKERWWCDPSQVEVVHGKTNNKNNSILYRRWYVNPLVIALGFLAGALVSKIILRSSSVSVTVSSNDSSDIPMAEAFTDNPEEAGPNSTSRMWFPDVFVKAFNLLVTHLANDNDILLY